MGVEGNEEELAEPMNSARTFATTLGGIQRPVSRVKIPGAPGAPEARQPDSSETPRCNYCRTFLSGDVTPGDPFSEILLESDNFVVVPTLGSLVDGWVLIVPRKHYLSFFTLPPSLFSELKSILDRLASFCALCFGEPTLFEHGPARPGSSLGCGIDHAHLHLAPLPFSLTDATMRSFEAHAVTLERIELYEDVRLKTLSTVLGHKSDYLFLEEGGRTFLVKLVEAPPSQFLRRVIARRLGVPDKYDYRTHSGVRSAKRTAEIFLSNFGRYIL